MKAAPAILRQALDDVGLTGVPFTTRAAADQTQAKALALPVPRRS